MKSHKLFMLTPWTEDGQGPYYCPDCGVVEGFFVYSPGAKVDIDIIHVKFERPRDQVVDVLGEENQSCPVLVLAPGTAMPDSAKKSLSTGAVFIDDAIAICNFLGQTYGGILPHP
ncbi:MAG: DUF3088 domain-containing protein [Desulfobacterales bacterium]|nr:DUF3088 domain-containing protein [Desulfobacterales bacterium]